MTVLDKLKKKYAFPTTVSDSDNELQLDLDNSTDGETFVEESPPSTSRYIPTRFKHRKVVTADDTPAFRKHGGKRRLRRYQNCALLQTLSEEDFEGNNTSDIFESKKTPLSKLIEDPMALQYWNEFIDKSEEEQKQIIGNFKSDVRDIYKTEKPFLRISSKIRRTLKIKRNLSVDTVKLFEFDIIQFFKKSPQEKYVKYPSTSFDRLLTHAVAQYHCLYSFSDWENERRKVEIQNLEENWTPAECFLHELISKSKS
ncbi:R3H domain-containing protein 4-like [Coccinella septempunctata]|uniref:R3H domain-containing protein 4-like n=1 Tax=Coccinella septempunctata TaxID=41139 RepID=UPI001D082584|nr:R3H domain-containing protein 4-like [Coccinella septempunctata]